MNNSNANTNTSVADELLVSSHLVELGYEVYRSASVQSAPYIVINMDGEFYKIAFRRAVNSELSNIFSDLVASSHDYDILAIVDPDNGNVNFGVTREDLEHLYITGLPIPSLPTKEQFMLALSAWEEMHKHINQHYSQMNAEQQRLAKIRLEMGRNWIEEIISLSGAHSTPAK